MVKEFTKEKKKADKRENLLQSIEVEDKFLRRAPGTEREQRGL